MKKNTKDKKHVTKFREWHVLKMWIKKHIKNTKNMSQNFSRGTYYRCVWKKAQKIKKHVTKF